MALQGPPYCATLRLQRSRFEVLPFKDGHRSGRCIWLRFAKGGRLLFGVPLLDRPGVSFEARNAPYLVLRTRCLERVSAAGRTGRHRSHRESGPEARRAAIIFAALPA